MAPSGTKAFRLQTEICKVMHIIKIRRKQIAIPTHANAKVTFSGLVSIKEMFQ